MAPETTPVPALESLEQDYETAIHDLRRAISRVLVGAGLDPTRPQEVSRALGVSQNLTWKAARIIQAPDVFAVLPQVPGRAGVDSLLKASKSAGVDPALLEEARTASKRFEEMIRIHADDRATMDLILEGRSLETGDTEPLEASRKLAFKGNSGYWGVQAKLRLRVAVLAPNEQDPTQLDTAAMTGLVDVRRLRSCAVLPLFTRWIRTDAEELEQVSEEPLEGGPGHSETLLMPSLSSQPTPPMQLSHTKQGLRYELSEGPVGNRGTSTVVCGSLTRRSTSRYRGSDTPTKKHGMSINAPVERLVFDFVVHRELSEQLEWTSSLRHTDPNTESSSEMPPFPFTSVAQERQVAARHLTLPQLQGYEQAIEQACRRLRGNVDDYVGVRFSMNYPPMPSWLLVESTLPERD